MNMHGWCYHMKTSELSMIRTDERKYSQDSVIDQILKKIIDENLPNNTRSTQNIKRTQSEKKKKPNFSQHIVVEKLSIQNKNVWKPTRGKHKSYMTGNPSKMTDFSTETLKARRACSNAFQALKDHCYPSRVMYVAKPSVTVEGGEKINDMI